MGVIPGLRPGVRNRFSDLLLYWHLGSNYRESFMPETSGLRKQEVVITKDKFNIVYCW